jgi:hypothetical protein
MNKEQNLRRTNSAADKDIIIKRVWSMPNKWTFTIKPIRALLEDEMDSGLWIDPFAGKYSPATVTNDLNLSIPANFHMDALTFLGMFPDDSVDGVLYDPPYSPRQVKECYENIGQSGFDGRINFWSDIKNEIARIIKPGGKAICFGWNSMGCGMSRGFILRRVLLVPHGGSRNDTICTVETKWDSPNKKGAAL